MRHPPQQDFLAKHRGIGMAAAQPLPPTRVDGVVLVAVRKDLHLAAISSHVRRGQALGHAKTSGGPTLRWPSEWPQRGHYYQTPPMTDDEEHHFYKHHKSRESVMAEFLFQPIIP